MFDETKMLADALGEHLALTYQRTFGSCEPRFTEVIEASARLTIERIVGSDALYHDGDHTALVTLVAQDILRGRFLDKGITPEDWLHMILAALSHDIGYVRGVCSGNRANAFVIDAQGTTIGLPRGASDAALTPYHIERSKLAVQERFGTNDLVDAQRVIRAIKLTRFPVPADDEHRETGTEAGLTRAADLIGQLGDPLYPRKRNALFHEFAEVGMADQLGYAGPADLAERYPAFFWGKIEPVIGDAIRFLDLTVEGRSWVANLYSHVFAIEHDRRRMGPHPG
ncbi:metal-dependent phosphohydrolase [Methylobacterium sp. P1-11]|uniref:metal-dependent phosphohydrolase n=1 Tax=Methylobacterium sp. P1-11 TaxID=2024616 RepID=UPI0011ECE2FF|nr:metal-dependent phosphohydrolase [Methylobacterium sp. P1-11]KAA0107819.1 metal-dependent phosphohydrolase [Methylobacterium sp. P1-11]